MKKHSSAAGPIRRIRALVAFRHQNPVARLVSTLLAIAMAMLLVAGTGAAYAGDTDPTAANDATTATTPDSPTTDSTTTDTTTPASDAGTTEPTGATDPAGATAPIGGTTFTKKSMANTTVSTPQVDLAAASNCNSTVSPVIPTSSTGNFEIDGNLPKDTPNTATQTYFDWTGVATWPAAFGAPLVTQDGFGDNGFTGGSKEFDNPGTWPLGNTPNGKSDIGTVRTWTQVKAGDVLSYFAFDRADCTGSVAYDLEYNQAANDTVVQSGATLSYPHRTPGDLLFQFDQGGNGALTVSHSFVWTVQDPATAADELAGCTPVAGYNPGGGWCPVTLDPGAFFSSSSTDRLFVEGMLDLSKVNFPDNGCLNHFGTLNLRSHTSESDTSALQDTVAASVSTPPGCGQLTIDKFLEGSTTKLPGATFVVSPDPATGAAGSSVVVTDNQTTPDSVPANALPAGITNPTPVADPLATRTVDGVITFTEVEPGHTYTVYEVLPPDGAYLLPALADRSKSVLISAASGDTPATSAVLDFYDPQSWAALTAKKTARGDYDTSFTWTITKGVRTGNDAFAASASNDSANLTESFDWQVTVGEGARTESNHVVTGAITISNPNGTAVLATVSDSLTGCTFYDPADTDPPLTALTDADVAAAGFQVSVPGNGNTAGTAYRYACVQPNKSATSNTATISVDRSDYPRNQGDVGAAGTYDAGVTPGAGNTLSPSITWDEHNTDGTKTVHVSDLVNATTTHAGSGAPWTHTWGDRTDGTYVHTYSSAVTTTSGHCASVTDTATITETGQSATATASHCAGAALQVTKNKSLSMQREYLWKIDKTLTSDAEIQSGQTAIYSVTVDKADGDGFQDSGWTMNGVVTVTNPNDWESVTMSSLVDHYSGDDDYAPGDETTNSCAITGSRAPGASTFGALDLSLDPSQVIEYQYSCTFTAKPDYDGTNTATATWSAAAAKTTPDTGSANSTSNGTAGVASSEWALASTPKNKVITVTDSAYSGGTGVGGHTLGTIDWSDTPHTFATYSITWTAPAGGCVTRPNTATITETGQDDSASVLVCNPQAVQIDKDLPTGTFDRTYRWDLQKFVKNADGVWSESATFPSIDYKHVFDYEVRALPQPVDPTTDDSNWLMSGKITLTNPNSNENIPSVSGNIVEVPSVGGVTSTCRGTTLAPELRVGVPFVGISSPLPYAVTIKSGDPAFQLWYQCTFSGKPSYSASNVVQFQDANGAILAASGAKPFDFAVGASHADKLPVFDNKVDETPAAALGDATWFDPTANAAGDDDFVKFDYSKELEADHVKTRCTDKVNTAWIGGSATEQSAIKDTATATICPLWHALTAEKSATGYYDIGWSVLKQVRTNADDPWSSSATETGSSTSHDFLYQVKVTQQDAHNYRVTGAVTVHNPNDAAVDAILTEVPGVPDATCTFNANQGVGAGGAVTVAPDDDPNTQAVEDAGTSYAYTCTFSTAPAGGPGATGTNTVHLEWSRTAYPQTEADFDGTDGADPFALNPSDGYAFTAAAGQPTSTTVKDVATVDGNPVHHSFTTTETGGVGTVDANGDWVLTWTPGGGPYTATYSRTITGTAGQCTAEGANPNTATMYETGDSTSLGSSTANAQLCVEDVLGVVVNSQESLTRTFLWDIDKSTTTPNLTNTTGSVSAHYNVTVTALPSQDSGWEMHGTVTVTNPNTFTDKTVSNLDVVFNRGGTCVLDDPLPVVAKKVGGVAGSAVVDFHCTFGPAPAELFGTVTATVRWDAGAKTADDTAPVATNDWLTNPATLMVNQFIKVYDDHAAPGTQDPLFGGTQLKWDDVFASNNPAAHEVDVAYDHTYTGALMPAAGACRNLVNTAWLVGDDTESALDSDTATVAVCTPAVIVSPPVVSPPVHQHHPHVLPNTGGPNVWLFTTGLALLLGGGTLVLSDLRRRRRS